jgi:hypothetical protein
MTRLGEGAHGEIGNANTILFGKPEGKRQFGRSRRRWEDNIKMDLQKLMCS